MGVSFGFKLPNCGGVLCQPDWATPERMHDLARRADGAGFDSVWLHDHLVTPRELRHLGAPRFYEPLITMATLAGAFPGLRVGVATVVLPLRDPVLLAKQIGTLDGFFPGRFMFGLGAGRYESEYEAVGSDLFAKRGRVSKEWLEIIRGLLTEDELTYEGEYRRLDGASMYPQQSGPMRSVVWYAGNSPVAARRAATLSDGWIAASVSPEQFRGLAAEVSAAREAAGTLSQPFSVAVSATIERPTDRTAESESSLHVHASTISGSADEVSRQLNEFIDEGVTHFLLSFRADEIGRLQDDMEWFSTEVMPLVHRKGQQTAIGVGTDRKGGIA
jgi:alkanesulfonate monooxygenase SsuD/methylene tetrahydromethanopterin reductase-like flavin-dependent oxidoreductase (luciferase family)